MTGLVGHKPTYGLVSRSGVLPMCWSLDHVGPMTRGVWDSAALLQIFDRDLITEHRECRPDGLMRLYLLEPKRDQCQYRIIDLLIFP